MHKQGQSSVSKPPILGLTGSIGSGKSTVANILASLGAQIVDSDEISHLLTASPGPAVDQLSKKFGPSIVAADGSLNRKALSQIVFADPHKLRDLESIVHPLIRKAFLEKIEEAIENEPPLIIGVVPLLFESIYKYEEFDKIVVVTCSKETSIARVMARNAMTREEVVARYDRQLSVDEKKKRADIVIENEGSEADLKQKVIQLFLSFASGSEV